MYFELSKLVGTEYFKKIGVSDYATLNEIQVKLQEQNAYAILGLDSRAEPQAIKAAYRTLILQFHPDRYLLAQNALGHSYEEEAIKDVANSVTYALTTAYTKLSDSAKATIMADASVDGTARGGATNLSWMLFLKRPPLVTKDSARDFIAKMNGEISSVIQVCSDDVASNDIKCAMQNLQKNIKHYEDLLLPDLAPLSTQGLAQSQAVSRKLYPNGVLHTQFHAFLLECLDDIEATKQALPANIPDEPVQAPRSKCQIALDFLKFLVKKAIRILCGDRTPIYQDGLYNGLFFARKVSVSSRMSEALDKIEQNLTRETLEAKWVGKNMTDENSCTSSAIWRDYQPR